MTNYSAVLSSGVAKIQLFFLQGWQKFSCSFFGKLFSCSFFLWSFFCSCLFLGGLFILGGGLFVLIGVCERTAEFISPGAVHSHRGM